MRKQVPGYPKYEIDETGEVYNIRTGNRLRQSVNRDGYHKLNLYYEKKAKHVRYIHSLVALTFLGPRPDGQVARHLDGNKANNHRTNIAYGTYSQNEQDKRAHGTYYGRGFRKQS